MIDLEHLKLHCFDSTVNLYNRPREGGYNVHSWRLSVVKGCGIRRQIRVDRATCGSSGGLSWECSTSADANAQPLPTPRSSSRWERREPHGDHVRPVSGGGQNKELFPGATMTMSLDCAEGPAAP